MLNLALTRSREQTANNDRRARVRVAVEWLDGTGEVLSRVMGEAPDGSTELFALIARAGACAYATASEGASPSWVRVSAEAHDQGRVIYSVC